ncbi:Uma2 family endonuclease [Clostridium sp. 19966]|uniref:Uma2 family endonuclease n=1 Tax=Clostridium sp. 19966 TaxID=2768166 RepID=UPI0028E4E337|nr:Uma2 family endonuclease [Clostridium sp. 19966]
MCYNMIVEVVSPFRPSNDYVTKLSLYENFKIRESCIVNPVSKTILIYTLDRSDQYAAL